jgi:hypothetical protein
MNGGAFFSNFGILARVLVEPKQEASHLAAWENFYGIFQEIIASNLSNTISIVIRTNRKMGKQCMEAMGEDYSPIPPMTKFGR